MTVKELQQHDFRRQKYVLGWLGGGKSGGVSVGIDFQRQVPVEEDENGLTWKIKILGLAR